MTKKFGIKVISESCGILPHTLRVWEQRYQAFNPERAENGQRLYGEVDLNKARLLAKLIKLGHSISQLAPKTVNELEALFESHLPDQIDSSPAKKIYIKNLLKSLSHYQIEMVATELKHLRMKVGAKEFIFEVILPIIREVGVLVAEGKYSVTQEHIISTLVRDQLSQMQIPNVGPKSTEMALATPEGNLHELPIIIADVLCRTNRISTRNLGPAHPAQSLAEALNELKCSYLVLGVVSSDQWSSDNIIPYLKKLDQSLNQKVKVLLGGGGPHKFPTFKNLEDIKSFSSLDEFDQYLVEEL